MFTSENHYVQALIKIANDTVFNIDGDSYIDYQVGAFENRAKEAGFIKLGSGFFSQAWTHPEISHYAIKLGFKKEDSGAAYAAYCRANQGKTGIPVIHEIMRTRACYVVLMDKLIDYNTVKNLYRAKSEYYKLSGRGEITRPRCLDGFKIVEKAIKYMRPERWLTPEQMESELFKTAIDIKEYFEGIASFDIHSGNIMIDKFGNLVITDPVSFKKETTDINANSVHALDAAVNNGLTHNIVKVMAEGIKPRAWFSIQEEAFRCLGLGYAVWVEVKWTIPAKRPKLSTAIKYGAFGCKKPNFLIGRDIRNGLKRK